ncbi:hypothetical protein AV530_001630 [Patagioenas fasciata monilis]|uniref:Uncharacterized protein n=1 Tax=Patagioenas fasciata monilis TaxID=372326 RepID=A0A1V4K532_PATFA|nr:hypothetical protein AV530_001630 [Patagioenas fasciata monilis]
MELAQAADLPGRGVAGAVAEHGAELQRGAGGGQPRPGRRGTQRQRVLHQPPALCLPWVGTHQVKGQPQGSRERV